MLKKLIEIQNLLQHQWEILDQSKLPVEIKAYLDKDNVSATMLVRQLVDEVETNIAVAGWTKGKGKVRYTDGGEVELTVYRNPDFAGVMIHRELNKSTYTVSHEKSGWRLTTRDFKSMKTIVKAVTKCMAGVDWTQDGEALKRDKNAGDAYKALKEA